LIKVTLFFHQIGVGSGTIMQIYGKR
jgi:hypothetical protein